MSKTWRRYSGVKIGTPGAKKDANRKFRRRNDLDVSDGNWYRKHYPQWDICDYNLTRSPERQRLDALAPEMDYHDQKYPHGGYWWQPRIQVKFPRVIRYVNADGHRRWRLPQGTVLPKGWTFNEETCQYHKPNDKWYNRITASDWSYTLVWIDHGKPVWKEYPKYKDYKDDIFRERETRDFRYSQHWPRYSRRDRKRARNMKGSIVSSKV